MLLGIIPYLLCFIAGLAFGKYVNWLDRHGTKDTTIQMQISTGDNTNQVQISGTENPKLPDSCHDDV